MFKGAPKWQIKTLDQLQYKNIMWQKTNKHDLIGVLTTSSTSLGEKVTCSRDFDRSSACAWSYNNA